MEELPLTPEDWAGIVGQAVKDSGHGDEVICAVESTMDGWKVTVNPVRTPQQQTSEPLS